MPDPLLSTKLYIPQIGQKVVRRPRLIERLTAGLVGKNGNFARRLTLVSAPAGYGKTTALVELLSTLAGERAFADRPGSGKETKESVTETTQRRIARPQIAWLSLDKSDNEIGRFLDYLIAAMQEMEPSIGNEIHPVLETDTDLPIEPLLTALVNDIAGCGANSQPGRRFILILDDYHLISNFSIHEALDFLIDHFPPCMHLVILTRVDPPMPLGRLRVQGALLELREVDLRFTFDESTEFLNGVMGLDLADEDIIALEERTEGWIAGLQLAALTLQGRSDRHDLVTSFSGTHRHLIDYLAHEVMSRQPEEIQSFLLLTSILERFNASLCDAVLGIGDRGLGVGPDHGSAIHNPESQATLEKLENANLFLIPLDNERGWYRYHHLFADFLRYQLRESRAGTVPTLFIRASKWYEARYMIDNAIEHAFESDDAIWAAELLDEHVEAFIFNAELYKVLRWTNRLPVEVLSQFPRLSIYYAWALQFELQLDAVESALALAEAHLLEPASLPESFPAKQITGHARAIRVYMAFRRGEYDRAVELSIAALKALPEENTREVLVLRGAVTLALGMVYLELDDADAAYVTLKSALPLNQGAGNHYGVLSCISNLAYVDVARGALNQVVANLEQGFMLIDEWSRTEGRRARSGRMLAFFRREMGLVQYERDQLNRAAGTLKKACDYFELAQSWQRLANWAHLVDVYLALGDIDRALGYYTKLKHISLRRGHTLPTVPLGAVLAQRSLMLSQSRPDLDYLFVEAATWSETSNLKPTDDYDYGQEIDYSTLARIMIARRRAEEAIPLLDRLITSAERGGRNGHLIAYLSLQAIAHHSLGETDLALSHLSRALTLAEPEGYVRTFVDLGPDMWDLLQLAARQSISTTYTKKLLSAFPSTASPRPSLPVSQIEPLNEREMQILQLMSARLTNQEIAAELYLSVNTVKWYARSIYDKLGVANRREAGSRAQELGILSTNPGWRPGGR
jgi:LuxR family maltose regulon positive regulatory protein